MYACQASRLILVEQNIRGISTHKVYPPNRLPCWNVRSYRTFSPLSHTDKYRSRRLFSATLAVFRNKSKSHQLDGMVLYVVRTFLVLINKTAIERLSGDNLANSALKIQFGALYPSILNKVNQNALI